MGRRKRGEEGEIGQEKRGEESRGGEGKARKGKKEMETQRGKRGEGIEREESRIFDYIA